MRFSLFLYIVVLFAFSSCSKLSYEGLSWKAMESFQSYDHYLLDTRSGEEYKQGHLKGAHHLPFSDHFIADVYAFLEANNAAKEVSIGIYASNAYFTQNQISEIKQRLSFYTSSRQLKKIYFLEGELPTR